jgi:3-(3-hydroxy-phenyl)propionate hydroxylase
LNDFDVAIVGLGPVGACLAVLLAQRGVSVLALERSAAPHALPRAAHCGDEAMRVLQAAGVADAVAAAGRAIDGFDLVDRSGRVRLRAAKAAAPFGWPASTLVHQPVIEHALRARLRALPGVEVRLGHEVTRVEPDADGVRVTARCGGAPVTVRAAYVVGCDGARSLVREALGGRLRGGRFEQPWLVVDVRLRRAVDLPDRLLQIADPARPTTYVPFPGDRRRWEFRLRPAETEAEMTAPASVRRLLAPYVDPDAVAVERAAVYTFHDLVAAPWRRGRLLLAGDAAHQMPPFLGEGLGAGLRDAATLAWMLDAVRRGAAPALLDAYEAERRPRVQAVTRLAAWLGRTVSAGGTAARVRDGLLHAAHAIPPVRRRLLDLRVNGPAVAPALRASGAPAATPLLPQPTLADGTRLDDALGTGFAVLGLGVEPEAWAGASPVWTDVQAAFVHLDGEARAVVQRWAGRDAAVVVVRPDRIALGVYGPADGPQAALDIARALGLASGR